MSFEKGGIADKLGNRYEGRWVAHQLLALLDEKIHSVTIESVGDDEEGVDLWIQRNDNIKEAQQCKARNGSKSSWSVSDLAGREILKNLRLQLGRDPNHRYRFISGVGSITFNDICEKSRRSGDPKLFYQEKILGAGKDTQKCFQDFCNALNLDPANDIELKEIFNYLQRTNIEIYADDQGTYGYLLERIDYLLVGASEEVILSSLVTYAENNNKLGKPIYADELREYLRQQNIFSRRIEKDARVLPALEELQSQFEESIKPHLICGKVIQRTETDRIVSSIAEGKNIIIFGTAGNGKSGVLFELAEHLKKNNIPYLPIRLDRRSPENTSTHFGQSMGLPDCPAYTVAGIAGDRSSVLILDQLDAIRWTCAHSNNALDVCKELVRHVQFLQRDGKKISVILSCRTFDLEHDPSIKNWLNDNKEQKFEKVEVKELPNEILKDLIGVEFEQMTTKEKRLLACPQNLSIWMKIRQSGMMPRFQTATDLMREFWRDRRLKITNETHISAEEINPVLSMLIGYVEDSGRISIPERVVSSWPKEINALCSYGILQKNSGVINFCHQRYLDYLIADNLLKQIDAGVGSVLDWLGSKERQSLFRREQLRQALVMMSEESPDRFLQSIKQVIDSDNVRFHIKHLVLEIMGSQEEVGEGLGQFCLSLFSNDFWEAHILETIFGGHPPYVDYLNQKGILSAWLESEEINEVNRSLWLLQSVADRMPDFVAGILEFHINKEGEWPERILKTICWDVVHDSDRMFLLRLELAKKGIIRDFVDWKSLRLKFPLRAIQLIEAVVSTWNKNDESPDKKNNRFDQWYDHDEKGLKSVSEKYPEQTWNYFVPHIVRLTDIKGGDADEIKGLEKWQKKRFSRQEQTDIARGIVELSISAGQSMAAQNGEALIDRVKPLEASASPIIQEIVINVYKKLSPGFADVGIKWLLDDSSRFRIKPSYDESEWKLAAELIEALSPHCSEALFRRLEETIVKYHLPNEKELARYYLPAWRKGYYGHYWGEAQCLLLPALSSARRGKNSNDLIKVLRRKFSPEDRFFRGLRSGGGWVGSKLDPSLSKISDRVWIAIISSRKVKKEQGYSNWIQVDDDHVLESSIRQFSSSLQTIAHRYPERFCGLALEFPDNVDSAYVAAILSACVKDSPDANIPEEERDRWCPASVGSIEAILRKFRTSDDRESAIAFCRIISSRSKEKWSNETLSRLVHYAINHPDLEKGKLNVHCNKVADEASVDELFQNTINCVRGVAAEAISKLLWDQQELLETLQPGIESLVQDEHPSVRMAAVQIMLPVINIDKDQAVKWFCRACKDDLRVAVSPHATHFYNYTIRSHFGDIAPVIQRMLISPLDEIVREGATQVTARWLFYGCFEEELSICKTGTLAQRQGIAIVASQFLHDKRYSEKCQNLLRPLLDDPDKEVRDKVHSPFHKKGLINDAKLQPFILDYIKSKTFADDADRLVYELEDVEGSVFFLADTILAMFDMFSSSLHRESRDVGSHFPHAISRSLPILLRLYEQALGRNKNDVANRCLDAWDALFFNRVGFVRSLTQSIEQ